MIYAIIINGEVDNLAVDDDSPILENAINVTGLVPRPDIGWKYDGAIFTDPNIVPAGDIPIPHIPPQIILSVKSKSMEVRIDNNNLFIGCLYFDPLWAKNALVELLLNDAPNVEDVIAVRRGIIYGAFFIAWEDCLLIQDFLAACGI